jgi:O-antigen biosynthesis protein WbqP
VLVSAGAALILAVPMAVVAIAVKMTSPGPALYWSQRVGKNNRLFLMPKFRTMRTDTPVVATHLLTDPSRHLTPIGVRNQPRQVRCRWHWKRALA